MISFPIDISHDNTNKLKSLRTAYFRKYVYEYIMVNFSEKKEFIEPINLNNGLPSSSGIDIGMPDEEGIKKVMEELKPYKFFYKLTKLLLIISNKPIEDVKLIDS